MKKQISRTGSGLLIFLLFLIILLFRGDKLSADSPLTSTDFYTLYRDIPEVREARKSRKASGKVLLYLLGAAPADKKAAVINALGWNIRGQKNAPVYITALANRKRVSPGDMSYSLMKPGELFVLGYLLAMDDYFSLKPLRPGEFGMQGAGAEEILRRAAELEPENFTFRLIHALVEAQSLMERSFCSVYRRVERVIKLFPGPRRNMKPRAVARIMKYINLYRDDCRDKDKQERSGEK